MKVYSSTVAAVVQYSTVYHATRVFAFRGTLVFYSTVLRTVSGFGLLIITVVEETTPSY